MSYVREAELIQCRPQLGSAGASVSPVAEAVVARCASRYVLYGGSPAASSMQVMSGSYPLSMQVMSASYPLRSPHATKGKIWHNSALAPEAPPPPPPPHVLVAALL